MPSSYFKLDSMDSLDSTLLSESGIEKTFSDYFIEILKKTGFDEHGIPTPKEISYFEDVSELKLLLEWFKSCLSYQNIVTQEELDVVQDDSLILRDSDQHAEEELESLLGPSSDRALCPTDEDVTSLEDQNSLLKQQIEKMNALSDSLRFESSRLKRKIDNLKKVIQESKKSNFQNTDNFSYIKSELNNTLQHLSDNLKNIISSYQSDDSGLAQAASHFQLPLNSYSELSSSVYRRMKNYFVRSNQVMKEFTENNTLVWNMAKDSHESLNNLEKEKATLQYTVCYLEKLCKTLKEFSDPKAILSFIPEVEVSLCQSLEDPIEILPFDTCLIQLDIERNVDHYLFQLLEPYYIDIQSISEMLVDQSVALNKLAFGWQNCDKILLRALNIDIRRGKLTNELVTSVVPRIKQASADLSESFNPTGKGSEQNWKDDILSCKAVLIQKASEKSTKLDDFVEPLKELAMKQQTAVNEREKLILTFTDQMQKILTDVRTVKKRCWDSMSFYFDEQFSMLTENVNLLKARLLRLKIEQDNMPESQKRYKNIMVLSLVQPHTFKQEIKKIKEEKKIRKDKLANLLKVIEPSWLCD